MIAVFSGFRDDALKEQITRAGGRVTTTVSGLTTVLIVKDLKSKSQSVKKAKELNIKIVDRDSFVMSPSPTKSAILYESDDTPTNATAKDPKYHHGDVIDCDFDRSPLTDSYFIYKVGSVAKVIKNKATSEKTLLVPLEISKHFKDVKSHYADLSEEFDHRIMFQLSLDDVMLNKFFKKDGIEYTLIHASFVDENNVVFVDEDEYDYNYVLIVEYNKMTRFVAYDRSHPLTEKLFKVAKSMTLDLQVGVFVNGSLFGSRAFSKKQLEMLMQGHPDWKISGAGSIKIPHADYEKVLKKLKKQTDIEP